MADDRIEHRALTRERQASEAAKSANLEKINRLGAYNLVKVTAIPKAYPGEMKGYVTALAEIAHKTPLEMRKCLGLKYGELSAGACVYRLCRTPAAGEFAPRGYTSLPGGLVLKAEYETDDDGYPRGQMAWQIELTAFIPVTLIAVVAPGHRFEPGLHPDVAKRLR